MKIRFLSPIYKNDPSRKYTYYKKNPEFGKSWTANENDAMIFDNKEEAQKMCDSFTLMQPGNSQGVILEIVE